MNPLIFLVPYIFFIILFMVVKNYYSHRTVRVKDGTLEEALKTADQYEIAWLKGGKDLVIRLAFYHLLKAGYFEKSESKQNSSPKYLFQTIAPKDDSRLADIEKEVLRAFYQPRTLVSCLLYKKADFLEKYASKLFALNLCRSVKHTIVAYEKLYAIFAWIASITYLVFGTPHNLWVKLVGIVLVNVWASHIIWDQILNKTDYFDGQLLNNNGKRYIKLFEKRYFSLPDFNSDALYKEAEECNPCSV